MNNSFSVAIEMKTTLLVEPHLMAFTTLLEHRPATPEMDAQGVIACTDGDTVWYGKRYLELPARERNFIFVHELSHGIFRHPDRAQLVRLTRGTINPALWNYAGDAIINEAIIANKAMTNGQFEQPRDFPPVRMKMIHDAVQEAARISGKTPPSNYDKDALHGQQVEVLYDWLIWASEAVRSTRQQAEDSKEGTSKNGECGKTSGSSRSAPGGQEGEGDEGNLTLVERMERDDAWDLIEQLDKLKELLEKGVTATELIEQINKRMEDARIKIEQIVQGMKLAGVGQGSMLIELSKDLPRPVVPWNRILRRVATQGIGTRLDDSHVRYGPSTMAAIARRDRRIPFTPGTTIFTERPRVLVIMDVSGSHLEMLPLCFSEIWSIAQMKGAVVDVMTFDDGVQEIITINNRRDFRKIMERGVRGGGGTSLSGVWEQVDKMRSPYRMAVIMTDGYLDPGAKPKIPVVWLVTPGGADEFGYGQVIQVPEAAMFAPVI